MMVPRNGLILLAIAAFIVGCSKNLFKGTNGVTTDVKITQSTGIKCPP